MLSKSTIEKWTIQNLSVESQGCKPTVPLVKLVEAILYRLKTVSNGENWRQRSFLVRLF